MTAVSSIKKADDGPKDLVAQWLSAPRFYRVVGVLAAYYWLAFWVEILKPGSTNATVMAMSVVAFWALAAVVFLTVPIFIESPRGPITLRIPFTEVAIDVPTHRPIRQTALFTAPAALIAILALAKVAQGANSVCTLLALIGLLVFFRKVGAARRAARKYVLGEVVFVRTVTEQSDGRHVRPGIVAGYAGPWIVLIPFTTQDESLNPEYVQFDKDDWPELTERNIYAQLTKVHLTKPEQVTYEAGAISDSGGLKLTEAADHIPADIRVLLREELDAFEARFDFQESDIEVPLAFGDEDAMHALSRVYSKREDVQERHTINALVGATVLTALSFVLHKVGVITFMLNHLDNLGAGTMVSSVSSASWTVGVIWSLIVGAIAWALVNWSSQINTWMHDEVLGDLVVSHVDVRDTFDRYWLKLGSKGHRILAAAGIGWLMAFTTSPSLTGCALFLIFTGASYVVITAQK